jgi:D-alanyl-D-alanine carboxypeptidase
MSSNDLSASIPLVVRRALRSLAAISVLLVLAGCSEGPASSSDSLVGEAAVVARGEPSAEVCASYDDRLEAATSKAAGAASYDALLAVISPECGSAFYTAGPSQLEDHHLVRIGSTTKTYVAVETLLLADEGKIDLDHRVDEYVPELPSAMAPATVRQLLQHTSGIFSYTETTAFWAALAEDPLREWSPLGLVTMAAASAPYFPPGAGWRYSNTNYVLLGMMPPSPSASRCRHLRLTRS